MTTKEAYAVSTSNFFANLRSDNEFSSEDEYEEPKKVLPKSSIPGAMTLKATDVEGSMAQKFRDVGRTRGGMRGDRGTTGRGNRDYSSPTKATDFTENAVQSDEDISPKPNQRFMRRGPGRGDGSRTRDRGSSGYTRGRGVKRRGGFVNKWNDGLDEFNSMDIYEQQSFETDHDSALLVPNKEAEEIADSPNYYSTPGELQSEEYLHERTSPIHTAPDRMRFMDFEQSRRLNFSSRYSSRNSTLRGFRGRGRRTRGNWQGDVKEAATDNNKKRDDYVFPKLDLDDQHAFPSLV